LSVTAWPVVKVDSTNGSASDTTCSGAGPGDGVTTGPTLSGTGNASLDATKLICTLPAGTDLTNVATDGSHVLYFADTTAGNRRFSAINAKAGSGGATPTVTVETAFSAQVSNKDWAIGGVRATVAGAVSLLLFSNNAAAGDAMPGWAVEMQSGHSETLTGPIDMRRAGDVTSGPITLRGKSGAATKPVFHVTANVNVIVPRGSNQTVRDFTVSAESSAVTGAITGASSANFFAAGIKLTRTSTNKFTTGITALATWQIYGCEIAFCTTGIGVGNGPCQIMGNYFHDITGDCLSSFSDLLSINIFFNVFDVRSGGNGINSSVWGNNVRAMLILGNTIDGGGTATGAGIKVSAAPADAFINILGNLITNMGTYGVDFSNAGATDVAISQRINVRNNNTYGNTSGAYHSASGGYAYNACPWAAGDNNLNPSYTSSTDFTPTNTSLQGTAYPTTVGAATSYGYPGAIQPMGTGGSSTPFPVCVSTPVGGRYSVAAY